MNQPIARAPVVSQEKPRWSLARGSSAKSKLAFTKYAINKKGKETMSEVKLKSGLSSIFTRVKDQNSKPTDVWTLKSETDLVPATEKIWIAHASLDGQTFFPVFVHGRRDIVTRTLISALTSMNVQAAAVQEIMKSAINASDIMLYDAFIKEVIPKEGALATRFGTVEDVYARLRGSFSDNFAVNDSGYGGQYDGLYAGYPTAAPQDKIASRPALAFAYASTNSAPPSLGANGDSIRSVVAFLDYFSYAFDTELVKLSSRSLTETMYLLTLRDAFSQAFVNQYPDRAIRAKANTVVDVGNGQVIQVAVMGSEGAVKAIGGGRGSKKPYFDRIAEYANNNKYAVVSLADGKMKLASRAYLAGGALPSNVTLVSVPYVGGNGQEYMGSLVAKSDNAGLAALEAALPLVRDSMAAKLGNDYAQEWYQREVNNLEDKKNLLVRQTVLNTRAPTAFGFMNRTPAAVNQAMTPGAMTQAVPRANIGPAQALL